VCVFLGKTALHWAAAVNNEEAAKALIRHHTNVDAQDEHNQTALFLAAREGSYQVAEILLRLGKANTDLPDHMEKFPRDIALERQHRDIAQLIEEFSRGPGSGGLSTLALPHGSTSSMMPSTHMQASAAKGRSKKSSASQRKQSARSVGSNASREENGLLHWHAAQADPRHHLDHMAAVAPKKKTKRQNSVSQSQQQSAAKLFGVLDPSEMRRISPEQPPSYENAINGQRARLAAMQQAASIGVDPHSVYHTGVAFEELQPFGASPDMAYASMMPTDMVGTHPQPTDVVLLPSSYLSSRLAEADLSYMAHNSPTVPSCHAYSPQSMAAMQVPEATVVSGGHRSQPPLSPLHRQMLQQRMQYHQNNQRHPHPLEPPTSNNFSTSNAAYVAQISAVSGVPTCTPTIPSSATFSTREFQFPTPPSNHNTTETTSPFIPQTANPPNGLPTPSPEASPGQWSSSSPNSAKSDWSERAQNSPPKRAGTHVTSHGIKDEPAYV